MENFTKLNNRQDLLDAITVLEKELSAKTGKDVALVAYSPVQYAALGNDPEALAKISDLEKYLSENTGKDVALVAFTI